MTQSFIFWPFDGTLEYFVTFKQFVCENQSNSPYSRCVTDYLTLDLLRCHKASLFYFLWTFLRQEARVANMRRTKEANGEKYQLMLTKFNIFLWKILWHINFLCDKFRNFMLQIVKWRNFNSEMDTKLHFLNIFLNILFWTQTSGTAVFQIFDAIESPGRVGTRQT